MDLKNIFARDDRDQVRVPEIAVRGGEVEVDNHNPEDEQNRTEQSRKLKLPKTTWY